MSANKPFPNMIWNKTAFRIQLTRIGRVFMLLVFVLSLVGGSATSIQAATSIPFTGEELLGKPEDTSITVNIVPASTIEYHYQYGTVSGSYSGQTANVTATGGQPHEVVISGLTANTHYYYRMRYHLPGETDWVERTEHSFWTQRASGSTFIFTVTSDSHATFNAEHQTAMTNVLNDHPDFHLDLGDTFYPASGTTSQTAVNNAYLAYRDPLYMDRIGHSVPIFLAAGNHEEEEGWNLDDTPFSIGVGSIQARKAYFPTPTNGGFYSGNTDPLAAINEATYGDEYREDYYAWEWGDALFVVIDQFQYTMNLPYTPAAGEGSDDPVTGDQWNWTLGAQQYNWFKQTLQNSSAKYKFVFSHHVTGGITRAIVGVGAGYVRGGAEAAAYFEWGGKNADGTEGFASHRNSAEFGTTPIHQLMVANGVSAYFHGHDHQYVYEKTNDGIVYQEVPSPSMAGAGFSGIYTEGDHGTYQTIKMLPSTGHLRITVAPDQATVDYVRSGGTGGSYSYPIAPHISGPTHVLTTAVSPTGGGTINPSAGTHTYSEGAVVSVTATPNTGYTFTSWGGACSGSGSCSVTMDADKTVTANFTTVPTYVLTTAVNPSGGGTISPSAGAHTYNQGAVVAVTATPNSGYTFSSWSGACTGSGTCSVTMNAAKNVTANFTVEGGSVVSAATPSNATPSIGQQVVVSINIDMSGASAPNNKLGGFTASLDWDPAILTYSSNSGLLASFTGAINTANVGTGHLAFNGTNATGGTGDLLVFQITFSAVGPGTSALNLEYSVMAATAPNFTNLLPNLTVTDGQVMVGSAALGDVNGDGLVNSTDALIVLSADVGVGSSQFCPMNCGDVNEDGAVNSTDALISLSYDVGMTVPFPVGTGACPASVTQPKRCTTP